MKTLSQILLLLLLSQLMVATQAQEVSIPNPFLNAGIRATLQKPDGPLTTQDLLGLTNLYLPGRFEQSGLRSLEGLEAAHNLTTLELRYNQLTSLALPAGLTSLTTLDLNDNQLTSLTLPAELTSLTWLRLMSNPLATFVLPEPLAVTHLAGTVADLREQGVSIYTYPLVVRLVSSQWTPTGSFGFIFVGPPAAYTILSSTDLTEWNELGYLRTHWAPRSLPTRRQRTRPRTFTARI